MPEIQKNENPIPRLAWRGHPITLLRYAVWLGRAGTWLCR